LGTLGGNGVIRKNWNRVGEKGVVRVESSLRPGGNRKTAGAQRKK